MQLTAESVGDDSGGSSPSGSEVLVSGGAPKTRVVRAMQRATDRSASPFEEVYFDEKPRKPWPRIAWISARDQPLCQRTCRHWRLGTARSREAYARMSDIAELFFPAIRWDATHGYEDQRAAIDQALKLGVGGFILFGGPSEHVAVLTEDLHSKSRIPLLIGADLERGAGQQFTGQTAFPWRPSPHWRTYKPSAVRRR